MTPTVLLITATPYRSCESSGIRLLHQIDALTLSGYNVELLMPPLGDPIYCAARQVHFPLAFPVLRGIPARRFSLRRAWYSLALLNRALRLAMQNNYALVHGIDRGGLAAWFVSWFCKIPFIYEQPGRVPFSPLRRWLARRASLLLGTNVGILEQARLIGLGARVSYLPNIPSTISPPSPAQVLRAKTIWAGGHKQTPVIVCVGTPNHFPFGNLPDAIKLLYERRPEFQYVFIGGSTREIASLRRYLLADAPELPVRFSGCLQPESLSIALGAATVAFLHLPSRRDPPMRLLDAYLTSTPVVALDYPEAPTLPGVVRVADDPEAIAQAMVALIDDPSRRRVLAKAGHAALEPDYTPSAFASGLKACYSFALELPNCATRR